MTSVSSRAHVKAESPYVTIRNNEPNVRRTKDAARHSL